MIPTRSNRIALCGLAAALLSTPVLASAKPLVKTSFKQLPKTSCLRYVGQRGKVHVVRDAAQLKRLVDARRRRSSIGEFGVKGLQCKRSFDFKKQTLVGFQVEGTCRMQPRIISVGRTNKRLTVAVKLNQEGSCERLALQNLWLTTAKLPTRVKVKVKVKVVDNKQ